MGNISNKFTSPTPYRRRTKRLIVILSILALLLIFTWHYCTAHTVAEEDLAKLKIGMQIEEVQKIMGSNFTPVEQSDGSYAAAVRKLDRWCMVDIFFDSDRKLTYVFHDH